MNQPGPPQDFLFRTEAAKASTTTLASFKFLGLSVLVDLKYDAASNAELTMQNGGSGDAGDIYTGLDRFGRLVETIWKTTSAELVHTTYGRNRVGGVTWQRNVLAHAMSPVTAENTRQDNFYWYDNLQQNYQHQRGDLAGTAPNYTGITNLQQTEVRSFDEPTAATRRKTDHTRRDGPEGAAPPHQTGNWLTDYTTSPSLTQSRTHNKANEPIRQRGGGKGDATQERPQGSRTRRRACCQIGTLTGPAGVTAPAFNAVGNMTSMPKPGAWTTARTLTWDAWNRLVSFTDGTDTVTNRYDALTRRIRKFINGGEVRDYYYDKQWHCIEERITGASPNKVRYVWSPLDRWTMILRKRFASGTPRCALKTRIAARSQRSWTRHLSAEQRTKMERGNSRR